VMVRCTCAALRCTKRAFSGVERGRLGSMKSLETPSKALQITNYSGGGGIRTLGGPTAHNGFRDRPVQPLRHPSGASIVVAVRRLIVALR
jgi:hypothetical protein